MRKIIPIVIITLTIIGCSSSVNDINNSFENKESFQDLKTLNFWKEYTISDANNGNKTTVTIQGEKRIMTTNALPNHKTGEFPNYGNPNTISAQKLEYTFPMTPKFNGEAKWAREPGVALNGIKFQPETAERFVCETGEQYRVEAYQDIVDFGLDANNAHVQPTGAYHYHGIPTGLVKLLDNGDDLIHIGFAHDGFAMYYSKSGAYKPSYQLSKKPRTGDACSYSTPRETINKLIEQSEPDGMFVSDWEYKEGLGDLDQCNGIEIDGNYVYLVTDSYPYVGRCLMGEFEEEHHGPPPGGHGNTNKHHHGPGEHQHPDGPPPHER